MGGEATIEADVRVIAATNTDLQASCAENQFRKDLYYRLNVFPIDIPPLRERIEDIHYIVEVILGRLNRVNLKEIYDVHPEVMDGFRHYSWPGNIRELENLMERAYILETTSMLTPEGFPSQLFASGGLPQVKPNISLTLAEARRKGIEELERGYLEELLTLNRGRIKESANTAGISTRQLHKLLTRHGIRKENYKIPATEK